jgi:hypothetical protein
MEISAVPEKLIEPIEELGIFVLAVPADRADGKSDPAANRAYRA